MTFSNPTAAIHVPDGSPPAAALASTTHLGIGAHQDDLELIAVHGIIECFESPCAHFTGVTVTDGGGCPRTGPYAGYNDEQMKAMRRKEQIEAADLGRYAAQVMLDFTSAAIKGPGADMARADIRAVLEATRPRVVYTHNLADKHDTHVAVALRVIEALRELPSDARPQLVLGCEAWRDLDWLPDDEKIVLDVSANEDLAIRLMQVFKSQIDGGKRYDLAAEGRRRANATMLSSHETDRASAVTFAMDLTPLIAAPDKDVSEFVVRCIERFAEDVKDRIRRMS
jgi:LmbE family N-acetylglucosaminyl deacetylase